MSNSYSGKLLLRIDPALHNALAREANKVRISINTLCAKLLNSGLGHGETVSWWQEEAKKLIEPLKRRFGKDIIGIAIFGSYVQGTATEKSDLDILIVMDSQVALQRSFYAWWDDNIKFETQAELAPQFVHLPEDANEAGGIWFEVATASQIVWERGNKFSRAIKCLQEFIASGGIRRYWLSGQPYWVRRTGEK